jgi:hypothetical protein
MERCAVIRLAGSLVTAKDAARTAPPAAAATPARRRPMGTPNRSDEELLEKIKSLPPDKLAEVEDFVDFLRQRDVDRRLAHAASKLSEDAFRKVWDHPDDAEYDRL